MTMDVKELKERIATALNSQEQATVTLLSSLLAVQDELGYVPEEAIEEVASFTNSTVNDAWGWPPSTPTSSSRHPARIR